jgi:hypothetical protein
MMAPQSAAPAPRPGLDARSVAYFAERAFECVHKEYPNKIAHVLSSDADVRLAEADLMRRVLAPAEFAEWLSAFLPALPIDGQGDWLAPGVVTVRAIRSSRTSMA